MNRYNFNPDKLDVLPTSQVLIQRMENRRKIHEQIDYQLDKINRMNDMYGTGSHIQIWDYPNKAYVSTTIKARNKSVDPREFAKDVSMVLNTDFVMSARTNKKGEASFKYKDVDKIKGTFTLNIIVPCGSENYQTIQTSKNITQIDTHCVDKELVQEFIKGLPEGTHLVGDV